MSVLRQWDEIEVGFAQHYHLSLDDLFDMSWRRFRTLFLGIFNWGGEEAPQSLADTVDWSRAEHVPMKDLGSKFGVPVNRVEV